MLEVKDLYVNYGAVEAIKGISFTVQPGEIVTLIGANGAGKTTTLHTISGLVKAKRNRSAEDRSVKNYFIWNRACAGGTPCVSGNDSGRKPSDGRVYQ